MASVTFTAKTMLATGYISGQEYTIYFECAAHELTVKPVTEESVSLSGLRETVLHRRERTWDVTTGAFIGVAADQFMCFLASVQDGSPFEFDRFAVLSGGVAVPDRPITCELADDGRRKRLGNRLDAFQFDFKIREAAAVDVPLYSENFYWDLDLTLGAVPDGWTYTRTGVMYAMDETGIFKAHAADVMPSHWDAVAGRWLGPWFGPAVTNSALYSSDISNAVWNSSNSTKTAANSVIDGGTAQKITNTGASGNVYQGVGTFGTNVDTLFAILEKGDTNLAVIGIYDTTASIMRLSAVLDFALETVSYNSGSDSSGICRGFKLSNSGPNGGALWVVAITTTAGALVNGNSRRIYVYPAGTGSSGYGYLHHVELHGASGTATSICPPVITGAASATRGLDLLKYDGDPHWWNGGEYTLGVEFERQDSNPPLSTPFLMSAGVSTTNYMGLYTSGATTRNAVSIVAGVTNSALTRAASQNNRRSRFAARFKANDFSACLDAGSLAFDSIGSLPATGKFNIGSAPTDGSQASAYVQRALFAVTAYSDSELQAWTT